MLYKSSVYFGEDFRRMTRINAGCKIKIMLGATSGIDKDPLPEGLEVLFFLQISKINMAHNKKMLNLKNHWI